MKFTLSWLNQFIATGTLSPAQVADKLTNAADVEQLAEAGSLIGAVANADHRAELVNLYEQRATEMEAA